MSTNCEIVLPPATRLKEVVRVLGILYGCKKEWAEASGARWVTVKGAFSSRYDTDSLTECAKIEVPEKGVYVMYHFEYGPKGQRGMIPASTAEWIAAGKALVDFFGGSLTYQDTNATPDYTQPERDDIHAEDDEPWDSLQQRIWAVKPLTPARIRACNKYAAY